MKTKELTGCQIGLERRTQSDLLLGRSGLWEPAPLRQPAFISDLLSSIHTPGNCGRVDGRSSCSRNLRRHSRPRKKRTVPEGWASSTERRVEQALADPCGVERLVDQTASEEEQLPDL